MRPELRKVWDDDISGVRQLWGDRIARGDWGKDHIAIAVSLAIDDHLVALDAQVAEARRLFQQHHREWDDLTKHYICIGCWGSLDEEPEHDPDCPIAAFLAATAGNE